MDVNVSQLMHCRIYYNNLTKHVNVNHGSIAKKRGRRSELQHEKSNGKITSKKRLAISKNAISNFFGAIIKKIMCTTKRFSRI
jgi:hypothetical protein